MRARSVLPAVARRRAIELLQPRDTRGDDRRAVDDRRALRWRALRHGHAGAERRVQADVGGPRGAALRAARRRVLAGGDLARADALPRGGLLGSRVPAPATGLRF